ncbi:hypothetical protein FOCC_FOCC000105 [Frankliniella occidentalis]|nr:hypothetical protein FOCC_FOCC000105 [Frankliniella occidentalis]
MSPQQTARSGELARTQPASQAQSARAGSGTRHHQEGRQQDGAEVAAVGVEHGEMCAAVEAEDAVAEREGSAGTDGLPAGKGSAE